MTKIERNLVKLANASTHQPKNNIIIIISLPAPDDLVLKLLGLAPLAYTVEAEAVGTVGQDPEAALRGEGTLHHRVHADAAHLVPGASHGEGVLHLRLHQLGALLPGTGGGMIEWLILGYWRPDKTKGGEEEGVITTALQRHLLG